MFSVTDGLKPCPLEKLVNGNVFGDLNSRNIKERRDEGDSA